MSEYNYCHGPNCHTYHTVSRIRGVKGNKVLRTRKISKKGWWASRNDWGTHWWHFFCDERCRTDYMHKHLTAIMRHEPRNEPLETPIEVERVKNTYAGYYGSREYVETKITER